MTRKLLLALGAAAVVALIVGLIVAVRGSASGAHPPATETPAAPAQVEPPPARPPVAAPSQTVAAPSPPAETAPPRQPGVPVIHDHRKDPPSGTPSPFLPETVAGVRRALAPALDSCASSAPAGAKATFSLQVAVRSAGGRVVIGQPELDGGEALGEAYAACIRNAVATVAADAPGQDDVDDRIIFALHVP
ncbi:MAG TPA: hypothetical protein VKE22_07165 [Haliangiales bacterium]|nr:hypothetical protein [Haliangiales bacterium]